MAFAYTNHIRMYYERSGTGHPLVLIAGAGYGGWFWHRVVPGLAQRYQVIVPDPRGAGETDKPPGPYSVKTLGEDIAGLLDELHIRGAFMVGHALGAFVAQYLALERPELVGKLVLAAATFGGPNVVPISAEAYEALTDRQDTPRELIRRGIEVSTAPGFADRQPEMVEQLIDYRFSEVVPTLAYQAQIAAGIGMVSPETSFEARLAQVSVPALILFGEHDQVVPTANASLMGDCIPGAEVKLVPDAGHLFPLENPAATVEVLTGFLGGTLYAPYAGGEQ